MIKIFVCLKDFAHKVQDLLFSYLPDTRDVKIIETKIRKRRCFDAEADSAVWQVVEYWPYPETRTKRIGKKRLIVGLSFTRAFFSKLDGIYRVLVLNGAQDSYVDIDDYPEFDAIVLTDNSGFDLGAHKDVLFSELYRDVVDTSVPFVLSNSSFKPLDYHRVFGLVEIAKLGSVLIGNGFCFGPRYYLRKIFHLQSYFLVSRFGEFKNIFDILKIPHSNKIRIIRRGEIAISKTALTLGYSLVSYALQSFSVTSTNLYRFRFYDSRSSDHSPNSI